jgi:hypothetical protein
LLEACDHGRRIFARARLLRAGQLGGPLL